MSENKIFAGPRVRRIRNGLALTQTAMAEALASARRIAALAPGAARLNKQTLRALKTPPANRGKRKQLLKV